MNYKKKESPDSKQMLDSFESPTAGLFQIRLTELLKGRSKYQAAKDWGINLSTLKNYFSRQESVPRYEVLAKISELEGVTIDWLLGKEPSSEQHRPKPAADILTSSMRETDSGNYSDATLIKTDTKLASIFTILTEAEKQSLFEIIVRKGVDTVLQLNDERNIKLVQCNEAEKDKLLDLLDSGSKKPR
ncbi:TPA: hypothetical protein ACXJN2_002051 [Serratia marcescens]|uniref:hypothetical protein n=1 Tax=Raoultella sp. BIGb0149 TaxID=2485116 RepID=UPI00105BB2FE|nr:hypothetical protein [Raoultella sp. BIGb0149]